MDHGGNDVAGPEEAARDRQIEIKPMRSVSGAVFFSDKVSVNFSESHSIQVYPSPSSGNFFVGLSGEKGKEVLLIIRDVLGKEYYSKGMILDKGMTIQSISLSEKLPAGIYVVAASSDDDVAQQRIVIK